MYIEKIMKKKIINKIIMIILLMIAVDSLAIAKKKSPVKKKSSNIDVRIDQVVSKNFPDMKVYTSVVYKNREPVLSLVRGSFSVLVDGQEIKDRLDVAGFQYTEEGISYMLLIAANGLMEGEPLEAEKQAAVDLSEFLREQDELSVYTYADEVKPIFEFQKKNESLVQKINKIDVMGSNPHLFDVLVQAARRLDESRISRKVIIIMSDGRNIGSRFTQEKLLEVLDEKNIPVYGIGVKLMSGQNLYQIAQISEHTGGGYIYADTLENIPSSMRQTHNQVSLGYVLKFKINHVPADNNQHILEVVARDKGSEDSFFKNFTAVKVPISIIVIIILAVISIIIIVVIIILFILRLRRIRKELGISKRKCPKCNRLMKDEWDECQFCKYLPPKKKGKLFSKVEDKVKDIKA
jgi:hypothetical protein